MHTRLRLTIVAKTLITPDTVTLTLAPDTPIHYQAGQFITLLLDGMHGDVRRSYSLNSTPALGEPLQITVKQLPNGRVSTYLVRDAQVGDTLSALAPAGQFVLPDLTPPTQLFMIAGGSGITPIWSLMRTALRLSPNAEIVLLNANRNAESTIFREEMAALAAEYPHRLRVWHYWSRPQSDLPLDTSNVHHRTGHVSNFLIEQWITRWQNPKLTPHFFLCGPEGLMLKARMTIRFMGIPSAQLHREIFDVKPSYSPMPDALEDAQVTLHTPDGEVAAFAVKAGQNILDAAYEAGIALPYNCKSGICTICSADCVSGRAAMYTQEGLFYSTDLNDAVFTCVGYPTTPELTLRVR